MKLLFSYDIFYLQKYGGISSYFANLAKKFLETQKHLNIPCALHKNSNLQNLDKIVDGYKIYYPHLFNKMVGKVNNFFFTKKINIIKPNVIHYTYFNNNFSKIKDIKKIINCWDLTHEKFNKDSNVNNLKKLNYLKADKIICPSYTVKKDLLNYYDLNEDKVKVTYFSSDFEIEYNKTKTLQNHILYVGSRSDYKNFEKFIKSFSLSKKLKKDFNLIIFGGENSRLNGLNILKKYNIKKNKFRFINGTNNDLKYYYKNVRIFIYPSRYEGFGIPLVESMRMGCPIISSNGGALKEIAGDGITYFDPDNVEDIKFKLESTIYDDTKLINTIKYGYERCKKYSWKTCAEETYDMYETLL
jgi:glycosyltransferase involved in cell wall biosynthesis